jgi:hypothetical protein
MRFSATGIFVCLLSAAMACPAQLDFMRQADPVIPAPADAAILHAIGLIDPHALIR